MTTETLSATYSSVLAQDVIMSSSILVAEGSQSPITVFLNTENQLLPGQAVAEVLVMTDTSGGQGGDAPMLCYLSRSNASEAGWNSTSIGASVAGGQVVSGTAFGQTYGFYTVAGNSGNALEVLQLQTTNGSSTWSPVGSPLQTGTLTNMGVANLPDGGLYMYGLGSNNQLILAGLCNGAFTYGSAALSISGTVSSLSFLFTSNTTWSLLAVSQASADADPVATYFEGTVGVSNSDLVVSVAINGCLSSMPQGVTVAQTLAGYYDDLARTCIFVVQGSDNNLYYTGQSANAIPFTVMNLPDGTTFTTASVQQMPKGLRLFLIDTNNCLWSTIQAPVSGNRLKWRPALGIAKGISQIGVSQSPDLGLAVAAVNAANQSLSLWTCANTVGLWRCQQVATAQQQAYTMPRYRVEFQVVDGNGTAVPGSYNLALASNATPTAISVGGQNILLTTTPVAIQTDALGYITVCIEATTSIAAPSLVLSGTNVTSVTANPAQAIHTYLSGSGTLNYGNATGKLFVFDSAGATLTSAQVGTGGTYMAPALHPAHGSANPQLAPTVATSISNLAALQVNPDQATSLQQSSPGDPTAASTTLGSASATSSAVSSLSSSASTNNGGFWDDVENWAADAWQHLKSGFAVVQGWVLDAENTVAHFLVEVENGLSSLWSLAVAGAEDVGHAIEAALKWVGTEVEDFIDWLKAIFDWPTIWQGKQVIEACVNQGFTSVAARLSALETLVTTSITDVKNDLDNVLKNWQTTLGDTSSVAVGSPPGSSPNVTSSNTVTSPHARWFTERVTTANPSLTLPTPSQAFSDAATALETACSNAETQLENALSQMYGAVSTLFSGSSSPGSYTLSSLIGVVSDIVNAIFDIIQGIVAALFDLTEAGIVEAQTLLTTPIDCAWLQSLWTWLATEAGYPQDNAFTPLAVVSLLGAVPTVVAYRIIVGTTSTPFAGATIKTPVQAVQEDFSVGAQHAARRHAAPTGLHGSTFMLAAGTTQDDATGNGCGNTDDLNTNQSNSNWIVWGNAGSTECNDWVYFGTCWIPIVQMIPDAPSIFSVLSLVRILTVTGMYDFAAGQSQDFYMELDEFGIAVGVLLVGTGVYAACSNQEVGPSASTVFGRNARSIYTGLFGIYKLYRNISTWDSSASDSVKAFAIMEPLGEIMMFARASPALQNSPWYGVPFYIAMLCDYGAPLMKLLADGYITTQMLVQG
jgi:hypothetical protein